jgi:hypothetical protein
MEPFLRVCPQHLTEVYFLDQPRTPTSPFFDEVCYCNKCPNSLDSWAVWNVRDRQVIAFGYSDELDPRWEEE